MATISSPGIASGIDIKSIVSQLVALERAPLQPLQTQANTIQSRLSVYGSIKSLVSSLGDAAGKLATASGWSGVKATSSNSAAVAASAAPGTSATSLSLQVQQLAKAQSAVSPQPAFALNGALGAGTLTIQVGTGDPVEVTIAEGDDSLSAIARQINEARSGVTATVLRDASGERLLMRSTSTGEANTFTVGVSGGNAGGLERLAFGPGVTGGMEQTQAAQNALATINNVAVSSASNTLDDTVPGITLTLNQETTASVEIEVSADQEGMRKNIQAFVDAYNALNTMLSTATRYNADTKTAGSLQGDSTAVGLQNALRSMMRSVTASSPFSRLIDIGIEAKQGGGLEVQSDKLNNALTNLDGIKALFTNDSSDATAKGFGLKIKAFADGLINAGGTLSTRTDSLQSAITRNTREQDKVIERAARAETRLLAQYNAMDAAVGRLSGLNAFVAQQITLWNKNTS